MSDWKDFKEFFYKTIKEDKLEDKLAELEVIVNNSESWDEFYNNLTPLIYSQLLAFWSFVKQKRRGKANEQG